MTAQGRVLPTTTILVTDDDTGGYIQLVDPTDIAVHVDMLTAQGRSCSVWERRNPFPPDAAAMLERPELDNDGDEGSTVRDAWRGR